MAAGPPPVIRWHAVAGRRYDVYRTDDLAQAFVLLQSDILYPTNSYTDIVPAETGRGYYQLDVRLP